VEPRNTNVLYATEYYNYPNAGCRSTVVNQKAQVIYQGSSAGTRYRVSGVTARKRGGEEIGIILPPGLARPDRSRYARAAPKITPIEVPIWQR